MMLAAGMAAAGGAEEAPPPPAEETEALIERILELEHELAQLLGRLSPEARAELAARRQAAAEAPPAAADALPPGEPAADPAEAVESPRGQPSPDPPGVPEPAPADEVLGTEPRCGTLEILDTNSDGLVSGADRDWRYLSLWRDDGDGVIAESELRSLYEHGIRRVAARLTSYTTADDVDGGVWVETDGIYFDLPGRRGTAQLVLEAARLARGRRLWLEEAGATVVREIVPLDSTLVWADSEGRRLPVLCR